MQNRETQDFRYKTIYKSLPNESTWKSYVHHARSRCQGLDATRYGRDQRPSAASACACGGGVSEHARRRGFVGAL